MPIVLRMNFHASTHNDDLFNYRNSVDETLDDGRKTITYYGQPRGKGDKLIVPGAVMVSQLTAESAMTVEGVVTDVDEVQNEGLRKFVLNVWPLDLVPNPPNTMALVQRGPGIPFHMKDVIVRLFHYEIGKLSGPGSGTQNNGIIRIANAPPRCPIIRALPRMDVPLVNISSPAVADV